MISTRMPLTLAYKNILFLAGLCLLTVASFGQSQVSKSRSQLEKEKKQNLAKINQARKILANTQKEKSSTLGEVKALNHQIANKEKQISLINDDIKLISLEMKELERAKADLKKQLTALQKEYAEMLYKASKSSGKITKLSFLFSSGSFTELFMRYKYLQQYSENRKSQLIQIHKISEMLSQRQNALVEKRKKQQGLVGEIDQENKNLGELVAQQNVVVEELSKKEGEIKKEIETTRAAVKNLNNLISSVISKEVAKREVAKKENARRETAREVVKKSPPGSRRTAETKKEEAEPEVIRAAPEKSSALSGSFRANRAKLPWPISEGFISDRFGVKSHPLLKGVMIDNNGVDIQTTENAVVYAVFEGVVLDISEIPGLNNVVAIQHGDYYTVYANLSRVSVTINQKVGLKDVIGTAGKKDGSSEINFQIWHNFEKLNPEPWLSSR